MKQTIYSVSVFDKVRGLLRTIGTFTNKFIAKEALENAFHDACDTYLAAEEELNNASFLNDDSFIVRDDIDGTDYYVHGQISRTELQSDYYAVSYVAREDLDDAGYDVENLSDADLERIADKMGDYYGDNSYSYDLESAADFIGLKKKY